MNSTNHQQDIDFVITWVDGNDPAWKTQKMHYLSELSDRDTIAKQGDYRFRDWELLHYWFRAVEKYAPWVRKIHFVTCGQIPEWMNVEHPKLHLVQHSDYIPMEYLPTFNSHTIEVNFHRIEGLAEQFVYFNDDIFITKEISPKFFFKKGLPCDCFSLQSIVFKPNSIGWTNGSDISVINKHYRLRPTLRSNWTKMLSPRNGIRKVVKTILHAWCHPWFPGMYYNHVTAPYLKSTLELLWEKEPKVLNETCRCRFREKTNVNQYLFKYWQLASGNFYPASLKEEHCFHLREKWTPKVCRAIRNKRYSIICINDIGVIEDISKTAEKIREAFEDTLPDKCSFEKDR